MRFTKILSALLAALMLLSVCVTGVYAAEKLPFTDVPEGEWYYDAVAYTYGEGLMNGTGDGSTFSPGMNLTRGMVVTVLYRNDGSPSDVFKNPFVDVDEDAYYANAAAWAYAEGVVTGTGEDEWGDPLFSPDRNITRQELAAMFARYAAYKHVDTAKNTVALDSFPDSASVASWAEKEFRWTAGTGIITGKANGGVTKLAPTDLATRAEFAIMTQRYNVKDDAREFTYFLAYEPPVQISEYTEPEYPLVTDADVYVAVDGDDKNPGTKEKPLATFEAAKAKVSELKKTAKDEIVVAFKAGNYGVLNNLTFTEEDAGTEAVPIKYCKYGDGNVIFRNGVYIEENEFTVVSGEEAEMFKHDIRKNVYKVDLKGRVDRFDPYKTFLFSENGLTTEAREPNNSYFTNMTTTVNNRESIRLQLALPRLVEGYKSLDGMKINGYLRTGWIQDSFPIKNYDPETDILTIDFENCESGYFLMYSLDQFPLMYEGRTDDLVYFSNLPEFVDSNGEYCFVNETSTLYVYKAKGDYWINEGVTFATVEKGADYISFVGLDFNTTSGDGIVVYSDHFTFDLGKIYNIGGKAAIHCPDYVRNLTVKNSEFFNCVDTCVFINSNGAVNSQPESAGHNVIENNHFHDFTLPTYFSSAIEVTNDVGTKIVHNEFRNGAHGAIRYNKCIGIRIEYNIFDAIMTKTADFGAVYTCGSKTHTDNITRYNIFMNIGYLAIYLDCDSSNQEVYGNIFYGIKSEIAQNGGTDNRIDGNVFIGDTGIGSTGRGDDGPPTTYMSDNIFIGGEFDSEKLGTVGENNLCYRLDENPLFVNPSRGDYRFKEGVSVYDIPFDKIGRY